MASMPNLLALLDAALDGPGYAMIEYEDGGLLAVTDAFYAESALGNGFPVTPDTMTMKRGRQSVYFFRMTKDQVAELKLRS